MATHARNSGTLVLWTLLLALAAPALRAGTVLKAVRVDKGPRLNGLLDDEVWKRAVPFTDFLQARPKPASPPSERTEVLVLYDEQNLYIGVYCRDSEPGRIAANTMAHDSQGEHESDDNVKVLLDPFQNKRTAYVFFVNPRGARSEGLAFGESASLDWDGIWEARARIREDGWSAELRIPFKTISFKLGLPAWGLNVERYIARKQETIRASGADLDSHFYNANEAAALEGISGIRQGLGISLRPYGLLKTTQDVPSGTAREWKVDGGLDVYKNFTPNFVGAVSINTDFAETEVDERQINLTRFPLFFPEKRTFFLEGSEHFNFGTSSGGGQYHASFLPFFSRRIGLVEGSQIPLLFGAKVFGRLGNTNISVVDVGTRKFDDLAAGLALPAKNLLAARISQNLWEESRVGVIFTDGNPASPGPAGSDYNRLAGLDFRYATSHLFGDKNLTFDAWGVYNWWPDPDRKKHAGYGFRLDYPNDLWDMNSSYSYYGDGLNPGLGFISRPGVRTWSAMAAFMPRPDPTGGLGKSVRQFFVEPYAEFYWGFDGRLETRTLAVSPAVQFQSGDRIEGDISSVYDVLPFDFEVADGVVLPMGPYHYATFRAGFESAAHRVWQLEFNQHFGQFYSGRLTETEIGLSLRLKG
ncbi:MAG TPA: DUF5916 domain-containing protein, partial [Burkholderiales bacterium]|nr:DUF5916 domain-containing protein [Burkholderiales bacterium]